MSRITTLTIAYESDLSAARKAYDDFVAHVQNNPIKIPSNSFGNPQAGTAAANAMSGAPSPGAFTFSGSYQGSPAGTIVGSALGGGAQQAQLAASNRIAGPLGATAATSVRVTGGDASVREIFAKEKWYQDLQALKPRVAALSLPIATPDFDIMEMGQAFAEQEMQGLGFAGDYARSRILSRRSMVGGRSHRNILPAWAGVGLTATLAVRQFGIFRCDRQCIRTPRTIKT
jgi:hypothetical protein